MALNLVNASGYQRGVAEEESSLNINIEEFQCTYVPERKDYLLNKTGERVGFAVGPMQVSISARGEISDTDNVMGDSSPNFYTAISVANEHEHLGAIAGGIYLDEVATTESREGWMTVSFTAVANAGVT